MINKYPNQTEILKGPSPPIKKEILITTKWKEKYFKNWKEQSNKKKEKAIKKLLLTINKEKKGKTLKIIINNNYPSCYSNNTIILENYSIITALHELGHHLNGESELKACRYSIWIFKTVFKTDFEKLEFKGHLLTKKTQT